MRVTCHYQSNVIVTLVNSNSTHNFLDIRMAKKLGCSLVPSLA
uniref:Uncharacterized protein n=1 Tax=Rhizophora mucronata TaxID=61149 RepID=A0A2P2N4P1_RHIMU